MKLRNSLGNALGNALGIGISAVFVACANGPCHSLRSPELAKSPSAAENLGKEAVVAGEGRIFVAKPDGSLQCGMAEGEPAEKMEAQLEGIKVYSRKNISDGKMHIQVCGSPTCRINVYEIPRTALAEAEKRGFSQFQP